MQFKKKFQRAGALACTLGLGLSMAAPMLAYGVEAGQFNDGDPNGTNGVYFSTLALTEDDKINTSPEPAQGDTSLWIKGDVSDDLVTPEGVDPDDPFGEMDNFRVTIPVAIHYVAKSDGSLVGPDNNLVKFSNNSSMDVHISDIQVSDTNEDVAQIVTDTDYNENGTDRVQLNMTPVTFKSHEEGSDNYGRHVGDTIDVGAFKSQITGYVNKTDDTDTKTVAEFQALDATQQSNYEAVVAAGAGTVKAGDWDILRSDAAAPVDLIAATFDEEAGVYKTAARADGSVLEIDPTIEGAADILIFESGEFADNVAAKTEAKVKDSTHRKADTENKLYLNGSSEDEGATLDGKINGFEALDPSVDTQFGNIHWTVAPGLAGESVAISFAAGDSSNDGAGTAAAGSIAAASGVKGKGYTLPANGFTAPDGYEFDGFKVGDEVYAAGKTILLPTDSDTLTITAQWKAIA